jgi:hypothetical protein
VASGGAAEKPKASAPANAPKKNAKTTEEINLNTHVGDYSLKSVIVSGNADL